MRTNAKRPRQFKLVLFLLGTVGSVPGLSAAPPTTALDDYVAAPDPQFAWKLVHQSTQDGLATSVLELTSQSWRSENEVDRPVWKHWLTIARPEQSTGNVAFLFIGGGSNRDPAPTQADPRVVALAQRSNTPVAELKMVPNQPLSFTDSPERARVEDDLVAYSRVRYIATGDPTWLVRLAMVKSGVRALDAVQQFLATAEGGRQTIDEFVVAGGSKRGWTTWLVAVVDPRVKAIVPLVIDALNSEAITRHHYQAYGFFSSALSDYVEHGLFPGKIGTPEYRRILEIEDPYQYRHRPRLQLPKYIVNAAGDEFFLPDNAQFYFHELPAEKHLRYVPNAKHSLAGSDAAESLAAFYEMVREGRPRPRYQWTKAADGSLRVTVTDRPEAVRLWQATNPRARDFRLDVIGPAYVASELAPLPDGSFLAQVEPPPEGFTAFFVELVYPSGGQFPLKVTTEVSVVPDRLPYDWPGPRDAVRLEPPRP